MVMAGVGNVSVFWRLTAHDALPSSAVWASRLVFAVPS
jgi:hypothetical protein